MGLRIAVVGGGAAGIFAAVACAEAKARQAKVVVYESRSRCLTKVLASGGGRCNLTNAGFSARDLPANYPRGGNELLGPFHVFGPQETIGWFQARGVNLKTETDGRVFPASDKAGEIVDCLLRSAASAGVEIHPRMGVAAIEPLAAGGFVLSLSDGGQAVADKLLLAMGGGDDRAYQLPVGLGHSVVAPAPALFGGKIASPVFVGLAGLSLRDGGLRLPDFGIDERGPLVVTHWGLSGPAMLRLSSKAARKLKDADYHARLTINFVPAIKRDEILAQFAWQAEHCGRRAIRKQVPFAIPARLWQSLVEQIALPADQSWSRLTTRQRHELAAVVGGCQVRIVGASPNRGEMVTAGGVDLRELDFKTMASKRQANLFLAGELLDIDGVTGGFNLQAAWTTGWIAGRTMAGERSL